MFSELAQNIADQFKQSCNKGSFCRHLPSEYRHIIESETSFLSIDVPLGQRFWHILHSIHNMPLCVCGNTLNWQRGSSKYSQHCSIKCARNNPEWLKKRKNTYRQRLGVDHPTQSKKIQEERKQKSLKMWGVDHPRKNKKVVLKQQQTCLERYGHTNFLASDRGQEIIKKVRHQKYNNNWFIQQAYIIHRQQYDYSKVNYINAHTKIIITCRQHGDFLQRPADHIHLFAGCPKCAYDDHPGVYCDALFEKYSEKRELPGLLYLILLQDENEKFIKIGITQPHCFNGRMHNLIINTQYTVLPIIKHEVTLYEAYRLEQDIIQVFKQYQYTPTKQISGRTECFTFGCTNTIIDFIQS